MIYMIPTNLLHKSLHVTICQNEAYASFLWVIPVTRHWADRSNVDAEMTCDRQAYQF